MDGGHQFLQAQGSKYKILGPNCVVLCISTDSGFICTISSGSFVRSHGRRDMGHLEPLDHHQAIQIRSNWHQSLSLRSIISVLDFKGLDGFSRARSGSDGTHLTMKGYFPDLMRDVPPLDQWLTITHAPQDRSGDDVDPARRHHRQCGYA